jgi:hypothetical protein
VQPHLRPLSAHKGQMSGDVTTVRRSGRPLGGVCGEGGIAATMKEVEGGIGEGRDERRTNLNLRGKGHPGPSLAPSYPCSLLAAPHLTSSRLRWGTTTPRLTPVPAPIGRLPQHVLAIWPGDMSASPSLLDPHRCALPPHGEGASKQV